MSSCSSLCATFAMSEALTLYPSAANCSSIPASVSSIAIIFPLDGRNPPIPPPRQLSTCSVFIVAPVRSTESGSRSSRTLQSLLPPRSFVESVEEAKR
ncbi:hypothetical protein IEQ34_015295 [Dendrobium chrysotoxum]|uniref:Secreted protein n=1 Tax=Dendrobium chrysotoxum TaxID=161865 RepID=A0AAV7GHR6_DENCH|nr:hypothetical protein IEQ34_015295 [Dendrobium chrysotoxum]